MTTSHHSIHVLFFLGITLTFSPPPARAQGGVYNPPIQYTTANPAGTACGATSIALQTPAGAIYTCSAGIYVLVTGGSGGTCSSLGGDVTGTCAANSLNPSGVTVPNASTATTQTSGDGSTLLATDAFVTANIAAVSPGIPVQAATTGALSNSPTYSNGTAGVGATLTAGSAGVLTIDTYSPVLNDRLVIKNQASTLQNGCYTLTTVGTVSVPYVLTRCTDYNTPGSINTTGTFPVLGGSTNINTGWYGPTNVSAIGTSAITFTQDSVNPTGPPNGNVKAKGNLLNGDCIEGAGGKTIQDAGFPCTAGAYSQSFTSQTSVTLTHNLGTTHILVMCFDNSSPPLQIGWNSLAATDSNDATITFTNSQTGYCNVQSSTGTPVTNPTLIHGLPFMIGLPGGSALTTASVSPTLTVPFACSLGAYNLAFGSGDTGTITVKFWKVATGTAIPTSANSINTSGVSIASGTALHSTTLSDFTTTTVAANDMMAMAVTAVTGSPASITGVLQCQ